MENSKFINRKYHKLSKSIHSYDKSDTKYEFGVGQSPFGVLDILSDKLKNFTKKDEYLFNSGLPELKKELSEYYTHKLGYNVDSEQIIIGPGSKQLIYLLLMVLDVKVYLPIPCWSSYLEQVKILNKKMIPLNTRYLDNWKIDKSMLEKTILKAGKDSLRLLVFNNPNNPTGVFYEEQEVKYLANLLKSDNSLILCDEIYEGLLFHQKPFVSMAKYLPEQSIIVSSLSKAIGAGGWRLGYMILPKKLSELTSTMTYIANQSYTNASTPIQYATLGLFSNPDILTKEFKKMSHILEILTDILYKKLMYTKLRCIKPSSTWYLFLDFSNYIEILGSKYNIRNGRHLVKYLYDNFKVNCFPGEHFGILDTIISVRLSLVDFDGRKLLKEYYEEIDEKWIYDKCRKPIEGFDIILKFVNTL